MFSGPQRERAAVAILEGVHLLADDVGLFADAARKQRRLFEDRSANFVVVEARENSPRRRFHLVPDGARWRQNVARAFDAVDQRCSSL